MKYDVAETLDLSDILSEDIQHKIFGPDIIGTYRKLAIEKIQTDGYYILLKVHAQSPFRNFESYLRILIGLDEDDIQLTLKQYNPFSTSSEISPGIYSIKDISEVLSKVFKNNLKSEDEFDRMLNFINPIPVSSNVITLP